MSCWLSMLLVVTCVGQTGAQTDAIASAWSARYKDLSGVEYLAEGVVVTTPDFILGLGTPTQDLPDDPLPIHIHAKLDFRSGRAWVRRDEYQWQAPRKVFERRITETTVNGERTRVVKVSPKTGMQTVRVYDDPRKREGILRVDTLPMWLNSGILAVGDNRSTLFSLPDYASQIERWTIVPDNPERSAGKFQLTVLASRAPGPQYAVTVDTRNQHAIQRLEERDHKGKPTLEIRLSYAFLDGVSIARQWETSAFSSDGKLLIHEAIQVKKFTKNCDFADDLFSIAKPDDG